jgi:hypothetical protein
MALRLWGPLRTVTLVQQTTCPPISITGGFELHLHLHLSHLADALKAKTLVHTVLCFCPSTIHPVLSSANPCWVYRPIHTASHKPHSLTSEASYHSLPHLPSPPGFNERERAREKKKTEMFEGWLSHQINSLGKCARHCLVLLPYMIISGPSSDQMHAG